MTKTTWTTTEITERLMKEAQAWVNEMNSIITSPDKRKDWDAYQLYYEKASQTLDCLSILTNKYYVIDTDADGMEVIHGWLFK